LLLLLSGLNMMSFSFFVPSTFLSLL